MIARITSLALALAMLTACEQEPAEPTPTPPNTGSMGQEQDSSAAGDRTRTQTQTPSPESAPPAEGGQHYGADPAGDTMHDESQGMTEEERQAALRACQQVEGPERERCQREVNEQSNPDLPRPGDDQ